MKHPVLATGAVLVRVMGFFMLVISLFGLPSAGAWVGSILGLILIIAATVKHHEYSADEHEPAD